MAPDPNTEPARSTLARIETHHQALNEVAAWVEAHPGWELWCTGGHWYAHPTAEEMDAITADLLDGADPGTVTRDPGGDVIRRFGPTIIRALAKDDAAPEQPVVLNPEPAAAPEAVAS